VASGGIVFTTIQKFAPDDRGGEYETLSDRRNIVFIADEAHRSQYGLKARVVTPRIRPPAKRGPTPPTVSPNTCGMPCPTPPSLALPAPPSRPPTKTRSKSSATTSTCTTFSGPSKTRATVKIYYEARLAKLDLDANERPHIDPDFEEVTEGEELTTKEKLKTKWAQLEAMVGSPKRLALVAKTSCSTSRTASPPWTAKGMIVGMSRRICVALYEELVRLRPDWHGETMRMGSSKW
jgi:type I restriction enzyme R subunit